MRKSNVFWAIILLTVGTLLLLNNFNVINVGWNIIWPVVLILIGLWVLVGRYLGGDAALETESVTVPLGETTKAKLTFEHGAGRVNIKPGASTANLVEGTFSGGVDHQANTSGGMTTATFQVAFTDWMNPSNWGPHGRDWEICLSDQVPLEITLNGGASENKLDLEPLNVTNLKIATGASSTVVTMPANAEHTSVDIDSGAASLDIIIPQGVAARIKIDSGVAGIDVDQSRFTRSRGAYVSPDYAEAAHKLDIKIDTGVGSVSIK
jgi:hypothetical protein